MTTLVADLASFNNEADPEVQTLPTSALVGNHEAVRRFGVIITEASLKQELFNMGIKKSYNEVTAQEKVMARLNIIMKSTTDAQGDAARTADGYANSQKAFTGAIRDSAAALGGPMRDALAPILRMGADAVRTFVDWNKQLDGMPAKVATASAGIAALTGGVIGLRIAMQALGVQAGLLKVALIGTGVGALVVAAGAAAVGIMKLGKTIAGMKPVQDAWTASVEKFRAAWEILKEVWGNITRPLIQSVGKSLEWIGEQFGITFDLSAATVGDFTAKAIKSIGDFIVDMSEWLVVFTANWERAWDVVKAYSSFTLHSIVNAARQSFVWVGKAIVAAFRGEVMPLGPELFGPKNWSEPMKREWARVQEIWDEMRADKEMLESGRVEFGTTTAEAVGDKVKEAIDESKLEVTSPDKVDTGMLTAGKLHVPGIAAGKIEVAERAPAAGAPSLMDMVPERDRARVAREMRAAAYERGKARLREEREERRREYRARRGPYRPSEVLAEMPEVEGVEIGRTAREKAAYLATIEAERRAAGLPRIDVPDVETETALDAKRETERRTKEAAAAATESARLDFARRQKATLEHGLVGMRGIDTDAAYKTETRGMMNDLVEAGLWRAEGPQQTTKEEEGWMRGIGRAIESTRQLRQGAKGVVAQTLMHEWQTGMKAVRGAPEAFMQGGGLEGVVNNAFTEILQRGHLDKLKREGMEKFPQAGSAKPPDATKQDKQIQLMQQTLEVNKKQLAKLDKLEPAPVAN
jgi:hypothetical protein